MRPLAAILEQLASVLVLVASDEQLTREIFGNVNSVSKLVFYGLAFLSLGIFAWGVWRRIRLWTSKPFVIHNFYRMGRP